MPYLHCPSCRLATFSAARYSSIDECPRCFAKLTAEPKPLFVASPPTGPSAGELVDERQGAA
jgi:hypothetical protein